MGGPGSGSWYRWETRRVIDSANSLDVRQLARQGALREGVQAVITWRRGQQEEGAIEFACESRGIVLQYQVQRVGGAWQTVHQEIALERIRTGFGTRALLRCSECQRRTAVVYLSNRLIFVCRVCMALPYKSQCEVEIDRLYRRMQKIRRRLGAVNGDMHQPVWHYRKPKGMHQRTYVRLGMQSEEVRMHLLEAWHRKLEVFLIKYISIA